MTAGGSVAVLLTLLTMPRVARMSARLDVAELPPDQRVHPRVRAPPRAGGVGGADGGRERGDAPHAPRVARWGSGGGRTATEESGRELQVTASREAGHAVLRFRAAAAGEEELNLQDRLVELGDEVRSGSEEQEISLRLLRHLASSVRHQQFRDVDIVTLKVAAERRAGGGR